MRAEYRNSLSLRYPKVVERRLRAEIEPLRACCNDARNSKAG